MRNVLIGIVVGLIVGTGIFFILRHEQMQTQAIQQIVGFLNQAQQKQPATQPKGE